MSDCFISVQEALTELSEGRMIILVDDDDRENEGDLVMAAEMVTPEAINFMTRNACGLVCVPIAEQELTRLGLPMMVEHNNSKFETAFTISVEAAEGVTTGISAKDRAHTIKTLLDPQSTSADIVSPGHVFPLRAREGGVLVRAGHTEGSVDLITLAGLRPAAVICEVLNEDGTTAKLPDLQKFALKHNIKILSINQIIAYRMQKERLVEEVASSHLPIPPHGDFKIRVFKAVIDGTEHTVLQKGDIDPEAPILVRVHSECLTGDVFGSGRCDCGWQLQVALKRIGESGGILLYMSQEGRGIGLANKIKAYALQDQGYDTVEANHKLGFAADHRDYGIGSQILRYLGVRRMRLMSNNPRKIYGLEGYGLEILSIEPLEMTPTADNLSYLKTKQKKLGHLLTLEGAEHEGA